LRGTLTTRLTTPLTELGNKTYVAALPLWQQAQKQVLEAVGSKRWTEMRVELDKIERACV